MSFSLPKELPASSSIILTTGLGLSDQGVPLRLPALLTLGLSLLRECVESGKSVNYVVYQATDFIIEANKLNILDARRCAAQMTEYLHRFVSKFYPDVASLVKIKTGADCSVREADLTDVEVGLRALAAEQERQCQLNDISEAFNLIRAYARHHTGDEVCLRYAAANVLLNGGHANSHLVADLSSYPKVTVVPLGGKKEIPFFTLTSALAIYTGCAHNVAPRIVSTGKMPAYYPCPDGDLLLGETGVTFVPPRRTKGDFEALEQIGASIATLQGLVRPVHRALPTNFATLGVAL